MILSTFDIFGLRGEVYPHIIPPVIEECIGTQYIFIDISEFKKLTTSNLNKTYWEENLYRAHWAALSNIVRFYRWFESCLSHSVVSPNYLGFCASLRSLLEAGADASYSLAPIPETLVANYKLVTEGLAGPSDKVIISNELENMLIHFQFARRLSNEDKLVFPNAHKAEFPSEYIKSIDDTNSSVSKLYSELCQVVHPASQSLDWLNVQKKGSFSVGKPQDAKMIFDLCKRYRGTIESILDQAINPSVLILQVLSEFPLTSLKSKKILDIDTSKTNSHQKIKSLFKGNGIKWMV